MRHVSSKIFPCKGRIQHFSTFSTLDYYRLQIKGIATLNLVECKRSPHDIFAGLPAGMPWTQRWSPHLAFGRTLVNTIWSVCWKDIIQSQTEEPHSHSFLPWDWATEFTRISFISYLFRLATNPMTDRHFLLVSWWTSTPITISCF